MAWLSLESDDSDLRRFLTRVIAALANGTATFGEPALALLQTDRPVPAETIVGSLVTELDQIAGVR